jgi:hypothetical protein
LNSSIADRYEKCVCSLEIVHFYASRVGLDLVETSLKSKIAFAAYEMNAELGQRVREAERAFQRLARPCGATLPGVKD